MIFNMSGGGGATLNFKIAGNPQPSNPAENTIWIDTDAKITGWLFSSHQPENPAEGMVWIATGASSSVAFNALKKNGITVFPLSAKQYASGAWADKEAKIYQGGEWADWFAGTIYKNGIIYGGYSYKIGHFQGNPLTDLSTDKYISAKGWFGYIYFVKVNLTEFTTLRGKITTTGGETRFGVFRDLQSNVGASVASKTFTTNYSGEVTVDVSNIFGEYYVGMNWWISSGTVTGTIYELELS